ncbi:MAG: hypothetical protein J5746_10430 [Victivallales bacterium]|nr:hypothetical protein [Victivallales bacterium]
MDYAILKKLVFQHSTPGDEGDVVSILRGKWEDEGWSVRALGHQALLARSLRWKEGRPSVLICAHADSPGYIVQSLVSDNEGVAITLGGPHILREGQAVSVKALDGILFPGKIYNAFQNYKVKVGKDYKLERGQRICWKPSFKIEGDYLVAPFLDNRVGCFLLYLLSECDFDCNVELAVTGTEEFLGFGAAALAANTRPDMVLALDVTYVDEAQKVLFGKGPVVTVCDKSIALSPAQVKALKQLCKRWKLPLQTEYYNYSGTDAAAFGKAGHCCPVLPLLLPTEGNHTSKEKICKADIESLLALLKKMIVNLESTIDLLRCDF